MNRANRLRNLGKTLFLRATFLAFVAMGCGDSSDGSDSAGTSLTPSGGASCEDTPTEGQATFYAADGTGACSFPKANGAPMVVALGNPDYRDANNCGACLRVEGPIGEVTVQVVDRCPECEQGHIDLSREAFEQIADPVDGIVPVSWSVVTCNFETPVSFHFKDGSSQFWTAVQVRNHKQPIQKFEYQNESGDWIQVSRKEYNFFVEDGGMGSGPFSFRITDTSGNSIEEQNIELGDDQTRQGTTQLPSCGE